jgi:hypothetical protein
MREADFVSSSLPCRPLWPMRKTLNAASRWRHFHAGRSASEPAFYQVTDCLHAGRTVRVPRHGIAVTVAAWLEELGAHSPLVDDLAQAVLADDWPVADAIGAYLSVDVTVVA